MNADSLLGKTFDEYRIEKPLGAGGMAKVYRALDVKLKRYVALKVIASDLRDNSDYTARFEREAQSIARLEHPNIVQIYRFGEANGMYYMAMQYVDGADLGWLIRDYKSAGEVMPMGDIVRVMQEIGTALDYAHSRDVIHRDVKPNNIMVDNRGRALLTDFGLALLGDVGTRGEVFGSPHYIAPEQTVSSANVVPQSDIYSLGITLFEMLTGEPPFTGIEPLEVSMRHLSEQPPAPSQLNAALSPELDQVVLRALEKEPFDRYLTCAEFSAALQAAVESYQPNPQPAPGQVRRPSLVLLPQKVHAHQQALPVPAQSNEAPSLHTTPAPAVPSPAGVATIPVTQPASNSWKRALMLAGGLFLVGIVVIFALLKAREQSGAPTSEPLLTSAPATTALVIVQQVASLTPTPTPFPTMTPTILPATQEPTLGAPAAAPTTVPITLEAATTILSMTAAPKQYTLLIARHADQSLVIVNIGLEPFPLNNVRLSNDRGTVVGAQWQADPLNNGECVSIWKSNRKTDPSDVVCVEKGFRITLEPKDVFWKSKFTVYFSELPVATCDQDSCIIQIQGF
ncbi:MAG: protein kinase [Chloroflexi bacterium]|nr:protein kinase [Chloroflexota bacterium]